MPILHNTKKGICVNNENTNNHDPVSYTFPENAYADLNGHRVNLSGLTVQVDNGAMHNGVVSALSHALVKMPRKNPTRHVIPDLILDNRIIGDDHAIYPTEADFEKQKVPYLSEDDFIALTNKLRTGRFLKTDPDCVLHQRIASFLKQFRPNNRKHFLTQIKTIVDHASEFPLEISLLYDDRKMQRMTHLVLTFTSKESYTLTIDNVMSILVATANPSLKNKKLARQLRAMGIDTMRCKEKLNPDNPRMLWLYKDPSDPEPYYDIEFHTDINQQLIDMLYLRIFESLKLIGLSEPQNILVASAYSQKATFEGTILTLQNRLGFMEDHYEPMTEYPIDMGTRLRAELVVLAYLLDKIAVIPNRKHNPPSSWCLNYKAVCASLDKRLCDRDLDALTNLHEQCKQEGTISLSPKFQGLLLQSIQALQESKTKLDDANHSTLFKRNHDPLPSSNPEAAPEERTTPAPTKN
jgi:hypothetical protein